MIYDKLDKCIASGANVVLSKLPIGDLATQYFADKGLFCAGRVEVGDMVRVCKATGATIQTSVNGFTPDVIGTCGSFEEKQVGDERFNLFTECSSASTATIVLRGGSEQVSYTHTERTLKRRTAVQDRHAPHCTPHARHGQRPPPRPIKTTPPLCSHLCMAAYGTPLPLCSHMCV